MNPEPATTATGPVAGLVSSSRSSPGSHSLWQSSFFTNWIKSDWWMPMACRRPRT